MMLYEFIDELTGEYLAINCGNEDDAWNTLCGKFGTGYVFENIMRI